LFIEPSCGHGDIIVALLKTLRLHKIPSDCISIHGYDIDPNAIEVCQQREEFTTSMSEYGYTHCIKFHCENFLSTKANNVEKNDTQRRLYVCCLGGPPYTSGAGRSTDIQRDIPTKFVQHCQKEWNADIITFILPRRYQNHHWGTTDSDEESLDEEKWDCTAKELKSSTFFFQGKEQVTQPSIIQTFIRYRG
jgi:hypothetical protein